MSNRFKTLLLSALLLGGAAVRAATLIDLDVNFSNDLWREVLTRAYGRGSCRVVDDGRPGRALELGGGVMLKTQTFNYHGGTVKVSLDARTTAITPAGAPYKVAWCSIYFVDRQGKSYGHRDLLCTGKPADWNTYSLTLRSLRQDTGGFYITVGNAGKDGRLLIDRLKIAVEADGSPMCGDPGFRGAFAVDHWYYPRSGTDWDRLPLAAADGSASYRPDTFPDGSPSLHLVNTATFRSARYSYRGEPLLFCGWTRQQKLQTGSREWANSGIQLVVYNARGQVIGHRDLTPLRSGSFPWTCFSTFIPAGSFRRDAAFLELWPRVFAGAKGEAWFNRIQLVALPQPDDRRPAAYDAARAAIAIDAAAPATTPIPPVWNATDISYFTILDEPVVRKILTAMRANGVTELRCREFLQGGKILKEFGADGRPVYDWSLLDRLLDWAVREQGFNLTPTLESTPDALAAKPTKTFCNRHAPQDYARWGRVAEDLVTHWIERYGLDTVKAWRFECWNEPRAARYFKGTPEEFVAIFNAYIDAMERVEKKFGTRLTMATFSGTTCSPWYKMVFDELRRRGKLAAINLISMHIYAGYVNSFGLMARNIADIHALTRSYPELKDAPLILTEVNGSSMPIEHNDSAAAAAWNVKANRVYLDTGVRSGYFFTAVDYLYNRRLAAVYFSGDLGAFTKSGVPKPVFNSIVLLNRLHDGRRLPLKSSNEPLDGIAVLAPDRTLKILLTSFDETRLRDDYRTEVEIAVSWPSAPSRLQAAATRIDRDHANAHTAWQKMGKPTVAPEVTRTLIRAAELRTEPVAVTVRGDTVAMKLRMPGNAVVYLELKPEP